MLKSLLAGLSLPSRDGRADQGLDEEGEGEWTLRFRREGTAGLAPPAAQQPWEPPPVLLGSVGPVGACAGSTRGAVACVTTWRPHHPVVPQRHGQGRWFSGTSNEWPVGQ